MSKLMNNINNAPDIQPPPNTRLVINPDVIHNNANIAVMASKEINVLLIVSCPHGEVKKIEIERALDSRISSCTKIL